MVLDQHLEARRTICVPLAYAAGFDDDAGMHDGVIDGKTWLVADPGTGLLVRREVILVEEPAPDKLGGEISPQPGGTGPTLALPDLKELLPKPAPKRFIATVASTLTRPGWRSPASWTVSWWNSLEPRDRSLS